MTLDQQIENMARELPTWVCSRIDDRTASWQGTLQPYETPYTVRIEHSVPLVIEYRSLLYVQPLVEVVEPALQRQEDAEEGPLPHVYWRHPRVERAGPFLCVFDADAREWTLSDPLSRTTVPFALHWLQSYELWLATKKWLGLGRHAGKESTGANFSRFK